MLRTYLVIVRAIRETRETLFPYWRRFLRLLALPLCYFQLDQDECTVGPWRIMRDLFYIFFVLKYYPDNYGPCRLWEVERTKWPLYYGSNYNAWPRVQLTNNLQPAEYRILFDDKELSAMVCMAAGLASVPVLAILEPGEVLPDAMKRKLALVEGQELVVKPTRGAAGRGVRIVRYAGGRIIDADGTVDGDLDSLRLTERFVVQPRVEQHEDIAVFNTSSLNTVRVLTIRGHKGDDKVIAATARFGVGNSAKDNWSAGGVAVGIDVDRGTLHSHALDKLGRRYREHPTTGLSFAHTVVPKWSEILAVALEAQKAFPFYGLLGLDIAITNECPLILEINGQPDFVFQEQTSGPLLGRAETLEEFSAWGLLYNQQQRALLETSP